MPYIDMSPAQLAEYRPAIPEPDDFDARWSATLDEARTHDLALTATPATHPLAVIDVEDVTFAGFGGDPVKAWLLRPRGATGDLPVIVQYNGYGGGRGLPHERLFWAAAGYAHLVMDTRGQGSAWGSGGHTDDASAGGAAAGPAHPGYMTRGILDFDTYYYRRVITDAVRAVDAARALEGIDGDRIVVAGGSQGGGLAIAAAGLSDVAAALVDVPFLCDIERGMDIADSDPYQEICRYLAVHRGHEREVLATLRYVDGVHHGRRATAPALFSAALRDPITPPSTVFAAYHAWGGPAEIETYRFNGHEGGECYQQERQAAFLEDLWS
ncbi:acetylxylan esterase [Demequina mangrovi]|uniref:Cephalosporin-C deacetylase n=1 Tax=Demequina mangrovi TaxID=1043493 RepID=A0A1H6U068_9MICO|nr:acetylxylan esterase [Demequina mangrovi]SEI85671.1 cephalosporin-C deacetylase [Demequina mangrovi]